MSGAQRIRVMQTSACALMLTMGCAGETTPTSEALNADELHELSGEVRYYAPEISAKPLTADEIGDTSVGRAVGLRVHGDFLVAWDAPLGEPRVGDVDSVVAAWTIVPISDDVRTDGDEETRAPEVQGSLLVETPALLERTPVFSGPNVRYDRPTIQVDWWEDNVAGWLEFWFFHPECA